LKKLVSGRGVSRGEARGIVRLVFSDADASDFKEGDVLVTRITDPTMVIMMGKASAIVCDIGGMTSHPSIVAREMGIPCIVACKNATAVLKNGMNVLVSGDKGEVYLME